MVTLDLHHPCHDLVMPEKSCLDQVGCGRLVGTPTTANRALSSCASATSIAVERGIILFSNQGLRLGAPRATGDRGWGGGDGG
jgi:hypothetical protein